MTPEKVLQNMSTEDGVKVLIAETSRGWRNTDEALGHLLTTVVIVLMVLAPALIIAAYRALVF